MAKISMILGLDGHPLPAQARPSTGRGRMMGLVGNRGIAYDAADTTSDQMANWNPGLGSPDNEINPYRDTMVSRNRDMVRNDGWGSGIITRTQDNVIGPSFRPVLTPDYRELARISGNKAFDITWAKEYKRALESAWRSWTMDPGHWCDVERQLTIPQLFRLAFRHKMVDGDALALLQYRPDRLGYGKAKFATALQIIDPDRLSNPQQMMDLRYMRGGVEIDDDGAPVAYHFREAHIGEWYSAPQTVIWQRCMRETSWGRPVVVHDFDHDRGAQHRGVGLLTPIIQRMKMLTKYDQSELEAAVLNAVFGAYLKSPFDPSVAAEALGDTVTDVANQEGWTNYQNSRADYYGDNRLMLNHGVGIMKLFPSEEIGTVDAARPNSQYRDFENAVLRNLSAGTGLSAQQISQDWSDVNYSSARAALLEAWKTLSRRREDFGVGFAHPILVAFAEEVHEYHELPLPRNAPDFAEARAAYTRGRWMGPGRGWVDPVAEKKGVILGLDAGISTMEQEVAENMGADWEEIVDQRSYEIGYFKEKGMPPPSWAQANVMAPETIKDPEEK
ncbi:phage portal protein [Serratia fonticola]|uniref:phage portal protein n=1 Tax=Serratia fonticola TaxID=47917 RepID=UPI00301C025E